jgi:hypothetical protein
MTAKLIVAIYGAALATILAGIRILENRPRIVVQ